MKMNRIKKLVKNPLAGGLAGANHRGSTGSATDKNDDGNNSDMDSATGDYDPEITNELLNDDNDSDTWSLGANRRRNKLFKNRASSSASLPGTPSRGRLRRSQTVRGLISSASSVVSSRSVSRRRRTSSSTTGRRSSSQPRSPGKSSKKKKNSSSSEYGSIKLSDKLRALDKQPRSPVSQPDDKSITARTTGGAYRGRHKDVQTRLEALALERSSSEKPSKRKKKKDRASSKDPDRKSRKGRKSLTDDGDGTASSPKPTRAASAPDLPDVGSPATFDSASSSADRKKKKKRHSAADITPEEMQRLRDRRDKMRREASKKKKKTRKSTGDSSVGDGSQSIGSGASDSIDAKGKKKKDKKKRRKSKIDTDGFPASIPERGDPDGAKGSNANPFGDGSKHSHPFDDSFLSGLSEDTRSHKGSKQREIEAGLSSFDDIWGADSNHSSKKSPKPKHKKSAADLIAERKAQEAEKARASDKDDDNEAKLDSPQQVIGQGLAPPSSEEPQSDEVLQLQQQLSEALQKVLVMSEEQIQDKDEFLKASSELARAKVELAEALEERGELIDQVRERDGELKECKVRIGKLEEAIERQLDTQDALEVKLEKSEDEIEKLLIEMQEMETKMANGEKIEGGGASLVELHEARKAAEDKDEDIRRLKVRVEDLEKEVKDAMTVPQLQIDELDQENKTLQGRLKAEKLESAAKLAAKEEIIKNLKRELGQYEGSSDAHDLASARTKLDEARADATTVREDLETAKKMIDEMQADHEDMLEKNSLLHDNVKFLEKEVMELTGKADMLGGKVLEWTERTYDWKAKAETLERKLDAYKDDDTNSGIGDSEVSDDVVEDAPQGLLLQAAMDKSENKNKKKWGIFGGSSDHDLSADEIRINKLQERNDALEESMAEIRSEMVRMQTSHKEELYNSQKKVARLQGENDALALQNATLQQLATQKEEEQ